MPAALAPAIDLRPLFAPRSIAVLGASPRNTIGLTLRDNLRRMGSVTACWFTFFGVRHLSQSPSAPRV